MVATITAFHFLTAPHHVTFHNIYRRLYYLPIVITASYAGVRGGAVMALLVSLAYVPHAFFMVHHLDPASNTDKLFELLLYFGIGATVGWFSDQKNRAQQHLQASLVERDALEAQLVRAGKLSALGQMTAGLAHELRNPLASIMGSVESLAVEFKPEHRKHRLAELLLKETERLNRVVTGFLSFARPAPPKRQRVDLLVLARGVSGLLSHATDPVPIDVDDENMSGEVDADPDQISQVLLNLMLNAREALREHQAPHILIHAAERGIGERAWRCVGVRDNGPGVDAAQLEQIFEPYFTTKPDGTGLGLAVSSRIMEAHDGFIDVDIQPDHTTFWLCFPSPDHGTP